MSESTSSKMRNYSLKFSLGLITLLTFIQNYAYQTSAVPLLNARPMVQTHEEEFAHEYAIMKESLIYDFGYTKEFADLVEVNLKRAVREEKERQHQQGIVVPTLLRQGNQGSEEEDDEESTTAGPTTPGASPGDVVRGVAGIITSLGTFNVRNFWQSFVNFFPPNQREGAQALVEASLGRRPAQWPTLPTTTTKLTTTTKDEDEIDSEETTKSVVAVTAAPVGVATTQAGSLVAATVSSAAAVGATPIVVENASAASVTEAATRAPTTKYMLIRRRTGTVFPDQEEGLKIEDHLFTGAIVPATTTAT